MSLVDDSCGDSDVHSATATVGTAGAVGAVEGEGSTTTVMSSEGPTPSPAELEFVEMMRKINIWISEFEKGCDILQHRHTDNVETKTPGGNWPHDLSLVVTPTGETVTPYVHPFTKKTIAKCTNYNINGLPTVLVVAWSDPNPAARTARVCDVRDNKVLALVPARHSLMDFRDADVILNSIHVKPHKSGPSGRPPLPDLAQRLIKMYESSLARKYSSMDEPLTLESCLWCGKNTSISHCSSNSDTSNEPANANVAPSKSTSTSSSATEMTKVTDLTGNSPDLEQVFICGLCLIPWHISCSKNAFAFATDALHKGLKKLPKICCDIIPNQFMNSGINNKTGLCGFCDQSIARRTLES